MGEQQSKSYARGSLEPPVLDISVGDLLRRAVRLAPDRVALVEGLAESANRRRWTYRDLLRDAEACAQALLNRYSPGDHVAIWAPNVPEYTIFQFGVALAGMVMVTINPTFRRDELKFTLEQSCSVACFAWPEFRSVGMLSVARELQSELALLRDVHNLGDLSRFLDHQGALPLPIVAPASAAQIQYTSGTTGVPKGAVLHHRGITNDAWMAAIHAGGQPGSIWLCLLPMFHVGACVFALLGSVALTGTIVPIFNFDPATALRIIEQEKISLMSAVPTMLLAMMQHPEFAKRDLGSLRTVVSGGAPVPAELVRRIEAELGVAFTIIYGQTEVSGVLTGTAPGDTPEDKAETCGSPLPGIEIKIVNPTTGESCDRGLVGELVTRGYHTMLGYHGLPEATAETVDQDGWLHTGDLCTMDDRGYIKVVGRLKDMIIRGGENVYPREIEEHLFKHEAVANVAVVGLPDYRYGEIVGAFVVLKEDAAVSAADLASFLRQLISGYKVPEQWFFVRDYPQTASGKIQKFEIRKRWEQGRYSAQPS